MSGNDIYMKFVALDPPSPFKFSFTSRFCARFELKSAAKFAFPATTPFEIYHTMSERRATAT